MTNEDCANCRFSRPTLSDIPEEGPLLKCHRFPPVVFMQLDGNLGQAMPDASDWCGEWQAS